MINQQDTQRDKSLKTMMGSREEMMNEISSSDAKELLVVDVSAMTNEQREALRESPKKREAALQTVFKKIVRLRGGSVGRRVPRPTNAQLQRLQVLNEMRASAQREVLGSATWLAAAEVSSLAGSQAPNTSALPNKWKQLGRIFAIQVKGADLYPEYGLESTDDGYRPLPGLAPIISVLKVKNDGWGMAYWFASINSYLDGKQPQDLLLSDPEAVLAAARIAVEELGHG